MPLALAVVYFRVSFNGTPDYPCRHSLSRSITYPSVLRIGCYGTHEWFEPEKTELTEKAQKAECNSTLCFFRRLFFNH